MTRAQCRCERLLSFKIQHSRGLSLELDLERVGALTVVRFNIQELEVAALSLRHEALGARVELSRYQLATESVLMARAASLLRVGRRPLRPVLKHGPRSFTCARAIGLTKPKGAVKAKARQS